MFQDDNEIKAYMANQIVIMRNQEIIMKGLGLEPCVITLNEKPQASVKNLSNIYSSSWATITYAHIARKLPRRRRYAMAEKLVVLDPGHGGKDPGASGPTKKREKDFVLTMALKVEDILKNVPNITVSLTRRTDVYLELSDRAKVANRMKADFFVSIHANSFLSTSHGSETFYKKDNSKSAAQVLNKAMVGASGLYDRGVKYGNFAVIRETTMPSVLLEVGFISNPEEEKLLFDTAFQDRVALAIAKSICDYMGVKFVVQPAPTPGKPVPVSYPIMEVTVHAEPAQKFEGINVSGTTWLPSRPIGEYLGGKIGYKKGQVTINGTAVETMNIGGTGYVTARALAENVGARPFWDKENPTKVDIYPKEAV